MKVLLIEDEQPAAKRLSRLIMELRPDAQILKCIDSVEDAVEYLKKEEEIDLIFSDIQLADGISFDIFSKTKVSAPVIFTTAFDHYAVKAFKLNSIDYLLKPVEIEELENAIKKFETQYAGGNLPQDKMQDLLQAIKSGKSEFKKRFLVKTAGRLAFVLISDVAFFFSEEGNTFIVTNDNERFLLDSTLEEIEAQIDPATFFRINRKMFVSLNCIKKIEPHFNNRYLLHISPAMDEEVIVSRQRGAEFRQWLDS